MLSGSYASPSRIVFDLGHAALRHLRDDDALGDVTTEARNKGNRIEAAANRFAMTLLTGKSMISLNANLFRDHLLVEWAKKQSAKYQIAPGVVLQLFARQTGKYGLAKRACKAFEQTVLGD